VAAGLLEVVPSGEAERGDEGVADGHRLRCGAASRSFWTINGTGVVIIYRTVPDPSVGASIRRGYAKLPNRPMRLYRKHDGALRFEAGKLVERPDGQPRPTPQPKDLDP
jgi:hypothetical protein